MRGFKKTAFILAITLAFTYSLNIDDEYATVEDDDNVIADIEYVNEKSARILWPYPLNKSNNDTEDGNKEKDEAIEGSRKERLLWAYKQKVLQNSYHQSYPQSPIVDMMMQSVTGNYAPVNSRDPFDFLRDSYPLPKGYSTQLDEYDYVIIGGGTAGSVLAARLSEDKPKAMVLLIEAGKPEMLLSDIPALVPYLQLTDYTWQYSMEHQPGVCLGSENQRCFWPRGKALGGTSVTNFMIYTRGRPQDWDRIAADGNYGWSYNEVLEYYKKSENCELKKYKTSQYHGRDGELTVSNVPFKTGLIEAFLEAGRRFGNPTVDYNAPEQLGFGYVQTTTNKGHRHSAAKAFLHPHKRRRNLHILTEARATKILIEPQTKRAYAVEYTQSNRKYTVRCRREVILSAGPIASPQLLMLSGIGPQEHLQVLGIETLSNLQVGRNLYDHIAFPGVIFTLNTTNATLLEPKVATLPNLMQFLQFGDGLLTTPGTVEGIGYIKTSQSDDPEPVPDVELISLGASMALDSGGAFRKSWKISDNTYYNAFGALSGRDAWSAVPMLLHPKSKGHLELRDTNPFSYPKMYGNYLTDPKDMATMVESVKYVIQLAQSDAFKKYAPQLYLAQYPSCSSQAPGSEAYWECAIKTMVVSLHHQIATCKMGPPSDPYAVVDPELRVYGIGGLRVVDSSVIPRTISAHTSAPAVMIAEKAADMIKRAWQSVAV